MKYTQRYTQQVNNDRTYFVRAANITFEARIIKRTTKAILLKTSEAETIWLPKWAVYFPNDRISTPEEGKIIIKDTFLERQDYKLKFYNQIDNQIVKDCLNPQLEQDDTYDSIITHQQSIDGEGMAQYAAYLENKEQLNKQDQDSEEMVKAAHYYEQGMDGRADYFIWIAEGMPTK